MDNEKCKQCRLLKGNSYRDGICADCDLYLWEQECSA